MDLRQLRSVVAVAEEKTFVKASRRLNVAQPALSRQIRSFEKEIGTAVFQRGRGGVTLTPAGEICLRAARSIIDSVAGAVSETRLASAGKVGTCTIYVSQWCVWTGFTGRLLAHLAKHDPGIEIIVREGQIGVQWDCLRKGHVDISIATHPPTGYDEIYSETLLEDVADVAILSARHPLARRTSITLDELANETLLTYETKVLSTLERELRGAFQRAGFTPQKTRTLATTESLLAGVSAGLGWSIHRRSLKGRIPDVATVPIENFGFQVPITLMHRANEVQPHILEVARRIREVAATHYPKMRPTVPFEEKPDRASSDTVPDGLVELRDLRYFAAVVEERGIGRAALRLGLTQPGLSRQIRSLEKEIGVSLVARATRGIVPTVAGTCLYKAAREILGEVSRLPAEVERGQRAAAGRCMIASIPSPVVRDILRSVIETAGERYAHLELSVHNIPTPQQPEALHAGEFDIGLCHPFFSLTAGYPELEYRELLTDSINGALLPRNHPLASRDSITFDDLADIPFIFFKRDFHPAFHDYLLDSFRRLGYVPKLGPSQNGLHTLWSMCEHGAGWAITFGWHYTDPPPGLKAIRIEGLNIPWGVNLLSRRNETRPAARAIIDLLFEASAARTRAEELTQTPVQVHAAPARSQPAMAG